MLTDRFAMYNRQVFVRSGQLRPLNCKLDPGRMRPVIKRGMVGLCWHSRTQLELAVYAHHNSFFDGCGS